MKEMEILSSSFSYDSWVSLISSLRNTISDRTVELSEDRCTSSIVERCEFLMCQYDLCNFLCITRNKLDNVLWQSSFQEDIVKEPIRSNGRIRRLPNNNI